MPLRWLIQQGKRQDEAPSDGPDPASPVLTVHVGDLHVGSTVALMPPEVELDDGGTHHASPVQLWYWECWQRFWDDTAELKARAGAYCVVVFGGDEREGDHHNTTQIWAKSTADQDRAVLDVLRVAEPVLDAAVFVRGTPAHDGPASAATEGYAASMAGLGWEVITCEQRFSWWHYLAEWQGVKFDVAHAPGTKSWVPHTTDAAAARHAQYTWEEYHKENMEPPDIVIRHHVHHKAQGYYQDTAAFFIPSWQLPTNWVKSRGVKSPRIEWPGGLRVLCEGGEWRPSWKRFRPRSSVPWARS